MTLLGCAKTLKCLSAHGFLIELMWGWVPLTCVLSLDLQRRSSRSLQSSRLEWRRQNPWYNDITSLTGLCSISVESFKVKCFADRCLPIHKTLACPGTTLVLKFTDCSWVGCCKLDLILPYLSLRFGGWTWRHEPYYQRRKQPFLPSWENTSLIWTR